MIQIILFVLATFDFFFLSLTRGQKKKSQEQKPLVWKLETPYRDY